METPAHESAASNELNAAKASNGESSLLNHDADNNDKAVAAANLIKTLDSALSEMSNLSTTAARNVEDARRTAREASEVARRYTARSYQQPHSPTTSTKVNGSTTNDTKQNQHDKNTRKQQQHESSSERLARSHAQDVLSLSLELERTKQALQQECMAHDATRSTLSQARAQQTIQKTQLEQVQQQFHSQLSQKVKEIAQIQLDLLKAKDEKRAAEEDAQLALELAMGNAESREQLESWLERALQEVQDLRQQLLSNPYNHHGAGVTRMLATTTTETQQDQQDYSSSNGGNNHDDSTARRCVRFAESPTVFNDNKDTQEDNDTTTSPTTTSTTSPRRLVASRSMVAAGRHLLHRATTDNDNDKDEISKAPLRSAQRLRQRLLEVNKDNDDANGTASASRDMVVSSRTNNTNSIELLQSCAERLGILLTMPHNNNSNDTSHVESVARQFCNSVESKLNEQKEDVQELQALCEFLETKLLVVGKDGDANGS